MTDEAAARAAAAVVAALAAAELKGRMDAWTSDQAERWEDQAERWKDNQKTHKDLYGKLTEMFRQMLERIPPWMVILFGLVCTALGGATGALITVLASR